MTLPDGRRVPLRAATLEELLGAIAGCAPPLPAAAAAAAGGTRGDDSGYAFVDRAIVAAGAWGGGGGGCGGGPGGPRVVDFAAPACDERVVALASVCPTGRCPRGAPAFGLASHPGFVFLPGLLPPAAQAHWARAAHRHYMEPPQRRSIDAHGGGGLRDIWRRAWRGDDRGCGVCAAAAGSSPPPPPPDKSSPPWCAPATAAAAGPFGVGDVAWCTFGYHYEWCVVLLQCGQREEG